MGRIKQRIQSDRGAVGAVETILLIALAIFAVIVIQGTIMESLKTKATEMGDALADY